MSLQSEAMGNIPEELLIGAATSQMHAHSLRLPIMLLYLPNSSDFIKEFEVSRRTVARDLDFLRDEESAITGI
jgi:hypothetical protein